MKKRNEQSTNIFQRFLSVSWKPKQAKEPIEVEPSNETLQYQLPPSFLRAVDSARVNAGYDILPRFIHQSNPQRHSQLMSYDSQVYDQNPSKFAPQLFDNHETKVLTRKIQFRRVPREQIRCPSSQPIMSTQTRPRPPIQMIRNPNLIPIHNRQRIAHILPMSIQSHPIFSSRF